MRFTFTDPPPADAEAYGNIKIARIPGTDGGKCFAKAWRGKAGKPYAHYVFGSPEKREAWIEGQKKAEDANATWRAEREAGKAERLAKMLETIQVGTILTGSWGYDQTNPEIWKVVERRGHAVWLQACKCEQVEGSAGLMSEMIKPKAGEVYGPKVKRLITANGVKIHDCCTITPDSAERSHYSSWYA